MRVIRTRHGSPLKLNYFQKLPLTQRRHLNNSQRTLSCLSSGPSLGCYWEYDIRICALLVLEYYEYIYIYIYIRVCIHIYIYANPPPQGPTFQCSKILKFQKIQSIFWKFQNSKIPKFQNSKKIQSIFWKFQNSKIPKFQNSKIPKFQKNPVNFLEIPEFQNSKRELTIGIPKNCLDFFGILEFWNFGVLEFWNFGISEFWNFGISKKLIGFFWNFGTLEFWNFGNLEI